MRLPEWQLECKPLWYLPEILKAGRIPFPHHSGLGWGGLDDISSVLLREMPRGSFTSKVHSVFPSLPSAISRAQVLVYFAHTSLSSSCLVVLMACTQLCLYSQLLGAGAWRGLQAGSNSKAIISSSWPTQDCEYLSTDKQQIVHAGLTCVPGLPWPFGPRQLVR